MNMFKKLKFGFGLLTGRLNYDDLIKIIVKEVNAKVDIPKLTEKQEAQLFTVVLNSLKLYFVSK